MKRFICLFVGLLVFVVGANSQTRSTESLRGLRGLFVYVDPLNKDLESGGLSKSQVQTEVEAILRRSSIIIESEPQSSESFANLAIVIDTVKHRQGPLIYSVEVSLLQKVRLARTPDAGVFPAQTWSVKAIGPAGANLGTRSSKG
jgi:hypothetical protein